MTAWRARQYYRYKRVATRRVAFIVEGLYFIRVRHKWFQIFVFEDFFLKWYTKKLLTKLNKKKELGKIVEIKPVVLAINESFLKTR